MRSQGPADPLKAVWNAESGTDAAVKAGQVLRWRACRSLWAAGGFREGKSFGKRRCRNRPVQRYRLADGLRTRGKMNADPNREALGAIPVLSLSADRLGPFKGSFCLGSGRRRPRSVRLLPAELLLRSIVYAALNLSCDTALRLRRAGCAGAACRSARSAWTAEKSRRRSEGRPAAGLAARSRPEPRSPPQRR